MYILINICLNSIDYNKYLLNVNLYLFDTTINLI